MRLQQAIVSASLALTAVAHDHESNSTFLNPIIPGFFPDPSCISLAEYDWTVFCATSSFSAFPGVPIHASKDLVNWKLISNALSRPEQLPGLANINGSTSGIWAPSIRYHDGTFYIMTTHVYDHEPQTNLSRWDNFIITSTDPFDSGSWSEATHFEFPGYDTSPFWDPENDNKTWVTGSHAYRIYPAITNHAIDLATGEVGDQIILWNGTGGNAPEGPHLYRKDGYYYLMIAEGGTGVGHMETIARSTVLNGPYESYENNPIVSNANTSAYFQTVGHADLFQDRQGQWWGVALSTRSGPEYEVFPMGRETVMSPVTWENGSWPVWSNIRGVMSGWPLPPAQMLEGGEGKLVIADDHFTFPCNSALPPEMVHWRIPYAPSYTVSPPGHENTLELTASVLNLTGYDALTAFHPLKQTFISRRQVHTFFTYSVLMDHTGLRNEGDEAGVSVFLTQERHFDLGIVMQSPDSNSNSSTDEGDTAASSGNLQPYLRFRGQSPGFDESPVSMPINSTWLDAPLSLEIKAINFTHYALSAAPAEHEHLRETVGWAPAAGVSAGFTGTLLGTYATTNGREVDEEEAPKAWVSEWRYEGSGQVRS